MKGQKKFNKIAEELGWSRPNKDIFLFVKNEDANEYMTIAFPPATGYENFKEEHVDKNFVINTIINICCHTKFKRDKYHFILPMLISDYFAHRYDFKNELIWAKKAMKEQPELTPKHFSATIREEL